MGTMAGQIRITPDQMRSRAGQYRNEADNVGNVISSMETYIHLANLLRRFGASPNTKPSVSDMPSKSPSPTLWLRFASSRARD